MDIMRGSLQIFFIGCQAPQGPLPVLLGADQCDQRHRRTRALAVPPVRIDCLGERRCALRSVPQHGA